MNKRRRLILGAFLLGVLVIVPALGYSVWWVWQRYTGIVVTVHNRSGKALQQVVVGSPEPNGPTSQIGTIANGQTVSRRLDATWEGCVLLQFRGSGPRAVRRCDGYVTNPGGFVVEFTVYPGARVESFTRMN